MNMPFITLQTKQEQKFKKKSKEYLLIIRSDK